MIASDPEFDRVFPAALRHLSVIHWTPVEVAIRAARLLAPDPAVRPRILDVGAGVGKACLVGALSSTAEWTGIERDPDHVRAAIAAAHQLGIRDRTRFRLGDASMFRWSSFDALYFYNPLGSLLTSAMGLAPAMRRPTVEMMIARIEQRLAETRIGTRVVTYHGFGGEMPEGYEQRDCQVLDTGVLELWVRVRGDSA